MKFEDHQQEAVKKAYDLLKEHFDACLIVVTTNVTELNKDEGEATQIFWAGGYMAAIGQAEYAAEKILHENDVRESAPGA